MTANQRRPGFRLPWSSEDEPQGGAVRTEQPSVTGSATPSTTAQPMPAGEEDDRPTGAASDDQPDGATATEAEPADRAEADEAGAEAGGKPAEEPEAAADAEPTSTSQNTEDAATAEAGREPEGSRAEAADQSPRADEAQAGSQPPGADEGPEAAAGTGFMHELVEAMRRVADEARQTRLAEARSEADTEIREIEAEAERRRNELRAQAEADIAGVGEWAKAEAERIRTEAEQRVAARRAELERQLAAESAHGEARAGVLRGRVSEYERELQAFHAKLSEIQDPAAFAAAVKRMPRRAGEAPFEEADEPPAPAADTALATAAHADGDNGVAPAPEAEDDRGATQAQAQAEGLATPRAADERDYASGEQTFTEIVVKGLGSFGAITGFRQQLASVPGVDAVGLSLGTTGEFIFKATHAGGFDVANAIRGLEGDAVSIEQRPEGGLRVTLDRPR